MLLLPDAKLEERRQATGKGGPLARLFDSLAGELEPLCGRAPYIPEAKALLSRAGGRCDRDGSMLEFDPWSPHEHRCPTCGATYSGELHHRAWVWPYQLWLAERSVHGALFALLRGDARHADVARDILSAYAARYHTYPNRDNVLGPTRLFFSTYLESIWLLQIVIAADVLRTLGDATTAELVRDRVVEPSTELIAGFDEGMSNRQVWNNAAMLAGAAFLGRDGDVARIVEGPSGLSAHLSQALLSDGTWYEGENYHQFALRGLWYGVTLAESSGHALDPELVDRFHRAFVATYVTALPDFTMPSRKDSQYAVSLRQWRMVELAELGFARTRNPVLAGALARSYETAHERRDSGRSRSTADVERNAPSTLLTRADLGWRALLHAVPELPPLRVSTPESAILEGQGYAVFRRTPDVYVGFEFGQSGGGHGHPDRLNLTLYQRSTRWLDDLGTGSYVDPSLHWYRSTLAHNAPLVDGKSQPLRDGELIAYEERGDFGWILAEFRIPERGVRLERAVVVGPDYLVDELCWAAPNEVRVELPWHLIPSVAAQGTPSILDGGSSPEDGFAFVDNAMVCVEPSVLLATDDDYRLAAGFLSDTRFSLFSADGPGQPASRRRPFYVVRANGREGRLRAVVSWTGAVHWQTDRDSAGNELLRVLPNDRDRDLHRRDSHGWRVETRDGGSITLTGFRRRPVDATAPRLPHRPAILVRSAHLSDGWWSEMTPRERNALRVLELGEAHYRGSEESWKAAGAPSATVGIGADPGKLIVLADVRAGDPHFARAEAINAFDNEHPDTLAAGIQLYVRTRQGTGAWMLVPDLHAEHVRVRTIAGNDALPLPAARWRRTSAGYEVRIELPLPDDETFDFDLVINETIATRQRRRGQLVLSGATGEFAYLRGDRHEASRFLSLVLQR